MGKLGAILSTLLRGRLSTLTVFVTDRCNARCTFCFNWRKVEGEGGRLLTLDEYRRLADGVGRLPTLIISGGEPFVRRDLPDILELFITHCGVRHLSIPTNAMLPEIPDIVRNVVAEHPQVLLRMLVGIDGLGEDHDRLRGVAGGFEKMAATVTGLRKVARDHRNLSLNAVTVYHAGNRDKIDAISDWIHTQGFFEHKMQIIRGDFKDQSLALNDPDGFQRAVDYSISLFHKRREGGGKSDGLYSELFAAVNRYSRQLAARRLRERRPVISCQAGRRIMIIREYGDVFPCELNDRRIGNLRDVDFDWRSLMRGRERRETLRWIRRSGCWCTTECNAVTDCVFNPAAWAGIAREFLRGRRKPSA